MFRFVTERSAQGLGGLSDISVQAQVDFVTTGTVSTRRLDQPQMTARSPLVGDERAEHLAASIAYMPGHLE